MNTIRLTREDADRIADFGCSVEFVDCIENGDVIRHIYDYGFVFNEFRLIYGDNELQYRCENDKEVFSITRIRFKEGIKENYIFTYEDYLEVIVDLLTGKKKKDDVINTDIGKCWVLFDFVTYVIYKAMNQEVILVEQTERRYTKKSSSKKATKNVYSLTDCVRKYTKHVNHCKHVITCEHWEVRGHFRRYKSGKVVYVKPFEKGKGRNAKTVNKVYKI